MKSQTLHISMLALFVLLVASAFLAMPVAQGLGQQATTAARCDLVAAYGTVIVVPGGQKLEVTNDVRPGLLEGVRLCVESLLSPDTLAAYRKADALLGTPANTDQDRADRDLIRVEIAALLSTDVPLRQHRTVARRIAGSSNALALSVQRQAAETMLVTLGWSPADAKGGLRYDGPAYVKACRQAGVPVPGSLNSDPGWSRLIDLHADAGRYLVLPNSTDASMWTYRDAGGGYCITFKRQKPEALNEPPLIATICTNANETHACFFDNLVYDGADGRRLDLDEYRTTDLSSLRHPKDGDDDCDTCHIGANPFLVDPKTVLGKTVAKQYGPKKGGEHFTFAGFDGIKDGWYNLGLIKGSGCMKCHDLPAIPKGDRFCSAIIEKAANTTMPPGYWINKPENERKPLWPDNDGCFDSSLADLEEHFDRDAIFNSLRQIRSLCSGMKVPMCPNSDGMVGSHEP